MSRRRRAVAPKDGRLRMRESLRGALLSVLFFSLLTLGMPVPADAMRCDDEGRCATDALVNVVAEAFPFLMNILSNPLGGDLGGLGPNINIQVPSIEDMIYDYAEEQLNALGGTAEGVCRTIRSNGKTANTIKIAGYTLALVLAVARLATQLNPPENEDVKEILDNALTAIVAGGSVYAILSLTCGNLGY